MSIVTKSNKAERTVTTATPDIIAAETLEDKIALQGEELCVSQINNQLTISFRSHIRGKIESETDGEPTYTDEEIEAMDFSDWKPESRTRKTPEEKAASMLNNLDPETLAAVLANYQK